MELISVIVPVYNAAAYLDEALQSLSKQMYENIEVIMVDDGSTDGSDKICKRYVAMDPRFQYERIMHSGVSAARNRGLQMACGELITFCDSDDWVNPLIYCNLERLMRDTDAQIAMCGYYDYSHSVEIRPTHAKNQSGLLLDRESVLYQILRRNGYFTSLWNKLFVKDFLLRNGAYELFDENLSVGEDEVWLVNQVLDAERVAYLSEPLYHWQMRKSSASRNEKLTRESISVVTAKQKVIKILKDRGASDDIICLANSRLLNDCYQLKVLAYKMGRTSVYHRLDAIFRSVSLDYMKSNDVPWTRKTKVAIEEIAMLSRLDSSVVNAIDKVRRKRN